MHQIHKKLERLGWGIPSEPVNLRVTAGEQRYLLRNGIHPHSHPPKYKPTPHIHTPPFSLLLSRDGKRPSSLLNANTQSCRHTKTVATYGPINLSKARPALVNKSHEKKKKTALVVFGPWLKKCHFPEELGDG